MSDFVQQWALPERRLIKTAADRCYAHLAQAVWRLAGFGDEARAAQLKELALAIGQPAVEAPPLPELNSKLAQFYKDLQTLAERAHDLGYRDISWVLQAKVEQLSRVQLQEQSKDLLPPEWVGSDGDEVSQLYEALRTAAAAALEFDQGLCRQISEQAADWYRCQALAQAEFELEYYLDWPQTAITQWMKTPHPELDGACPALMLAGQQWYDALRLVARQRCWHESEE